MKSPNLEALKEIARWGLLLAVSWFVSETLKQASVLPEFYNLKLWVFHYVLPVRELFTVLLTLCGRYVDKFIFEKDRQSGKARFANEHPKGLLPW